MIILLYRMALKLGQYERARNVTLFFFDLPLILVRFVLQRGDINVVKKRSIFLLSQTRCLDPF